MLPPVRKSFKLSLEILRESVRAQMSRQIRHLYEFGPFRLDPEKPCLWRNGELVSLTPKAVETLVVLVQQSGKLVEREQLMNAIWPDTFVEDNNLNFNVSVLRKALGTNETASNTSRPSRVRVTDLVPRCGRSRKKCRRSPWRDNRASAFESDGAERPIGSEAVRESPPRIGDSPSESQALRSSCNGGVTCGWRSRVDVWVAATDRSSFAAWNVRQFAPSPCSRSSL